MLVKFNNKGQITMFIIIALVIVAIVALLAYFWNDIKTIGVEATPQKFIESCMSEPIKNSVSNIFEHGGTLNNTNFILYNGQKIEYLCYTNEYYKTCVNQQPILKDFVEKELNNALKSSASNCISSLKQDLENKGYSVTASQRTVLTANLTLGRTEFLISSPITISKDSDSQTITSFRISDPSKLYDLVMSAIYVINWEARYGDFDTLTFMLSYPDLRLEKQKQSEGSKIYILSSRSTNEKFIFASRSLSWPPGFPVNARAEE